MILKSRRHYFLVWISLLLLLTLTSTTAYINLGFGNTVLSMSVSVIKALIIAVFFMHVLEADAALRLTIMLPLFLFFLLFFLSLSDFFTRDIQAAPWNGPLR